MRQIVLDTETTGLEPTQGHRIIEIGCVELIDRRLTGNNYHQYIQPEREIDSGAVKVHGITQEFLADKPVFKDIIDEFMDYIHGAELIIHNAPFDVGFIDHEFAMQSKKHPKVAKICGILDTLKLAREMHPGQRNSLDALCQRYYISNTHRKLHGALLDAEILADVYLAMTGGQSSLFGEDDSAASVEEQESLQTASAVKTIDTTNFKVIHANADEQQQHQAILKQIQENSGQVLWRD